MIKIDRLIDENKKFNVKMLLQIHDELILNAQIENYAKEVIKDCMTSVSRSDYHTFAIPLEVNIQDIIGERHIKKMMEFSSLTATELINKLRKGDISSVDLCKFTLKGLINLKKM